MVIALAGLMPDGDIGSTAVALAFVGLFSTAGLALLLYPIRQGKLRLTPFIPLAIPLILYALQLANGIAIEMSPRDVGNMDNQAVLSIVFFAFATARAWRLVGIPESDLLHAMARALWQAARSGTSGDPQDGSG